MYGIIYYTDLPYHSQSSFYMDLRRNDINAWAETHLVEIEQKAGNQKFKKYRSIVHSRRPFYNDLWVKDGAKEDPSGR